ncbi:MAG: hypothetical protein ACRETC_08580 [Gammaproteobacteria bacterium]
MSGQGKAAGLVTQAALITTSTVNFTTTRLWLAGYLLEEKRQEYAAGECRIRAALCCITLAILRTAGSFRHV